MRWTTVLLLWLVAVTTLLIGCGQTTCFVALECVERCGGPIVASGCSCPSGTFELGRCTDAAAFDAGPPLDTGAPIDAGAAADASSGTECTDNLGCGLRAASCCGSCGAATRDDLLAAPVSELAALGAQICEAEGNPGCPECARPDDPYLAALCRVGSCVGVDLREEPITECASPSDCTLAARRCCACGVIGAEEAIAYNPARGSLSEIVCGGDVLCEDPCVPTFASGVTSDCVDGRCVVFGPD